MTSEPIEEPAAACDCFGMTGTLAHDPACPNAVDRSDPDFHAREAARTEKERHAAIRSAACNPPKADWLAAMLRNYAEQDDVLTGARSVIVPLPNDPLSFLVLQRGGDHLMVQVNRIDLAVY